MSNPRSHKRIWHTVSVGDTLLEDHSWKRCTEEYLPQLTTRGKLRTHTPNIDVDDLWFSRKTSFDLSRNKWPLVCIIKLCPSDVGNIWNLKIKSAQGTMMRPTHNLCKRKGVARETVVWETMAMLPENGKRFTWERLRRKRYTHLIIHLLRRARYARTPLITFCISLIIVKLRLNSLNQQYSNVRWNLSLKWVLFLEKSKNISNYFIKEVFFHFWWKNTFRTTLHGTVDVRVWIVTKLVYTN